MRVPSADDIFDPQGRIFDVSVLAIEVKQLVDVPTITMALCWSFTLTLRIHVALSSLSIYNFAPPLCCGRSWCIDDTYISRLRTSSFCWRSWRVVHNQTYHLYVMVWRLCLYRPSSYAINSLWRGRRCNDCSLSVMKADSVGVCHSLRSLKAIAGYRSIDFWLICSDVKCRHI